MAHCTLANHSPLGEVFLLSHRIRLGEPRAKLGVDVSELFQAEGVQVVAWGERLDAAESGMLEPPCEHQVTIEPAAPRRHLRERHAHVKCDAGLFRKHFHRPDGANGGHHGVEQCANLRRLPGEMVREIVTSTGMGLIAIRELTTAACASPERRTIQGLARERVMSDDTTTQGIVSGCRSA